MPEENRIREEGRISSDLGEAALARMIQEEPDEDGTIHAAAAEARFARTGEVDERTAQYVRLAVEERKPSAEACRMASGIMYAVFNRYWLEEPFPKLRETDHSQGKKRKITILKNMLLKAEAHVQELQTWSGPASAVCVYSEMPVLEKLVRQLPEVEKAVTNAYEAAEGYEQSITGIYSSKEKKQELDHALAQLTSETTAWEALLTEEAPASEAMQRLHRLIGMKRVKDNVERIRSYLVFEKERKKAGYEAGGIQSLNMIITGNPGTGKTTIASLLSSIYAELEVLPDGIFVEADRAKLVGAYMGQTEEKTRAAVQEARGGVLFIDEAPALLGSESGQDYGSIVVDTLVAAMTSGETAGTFAVILAGYADEMRKLLRQNPGLRSRFPEANFVHLEDYSMEELVQIAEAAALDRDYTLSREAYPELRRRLEKAQVDESFGNARTARQLIDEAVFRQGAAAVEKDDFSTEQMTVLGADAFHEEDDQDRDDAEERLHQLIGLENVKSQVARLASFVRVQQQRRASGRPVVPVQLHAVFSGPPGTGKTTVAGIYAEVLHKLGLLKRGHVITAGRSDLVAGYTGQTALKTRQLVKQALGGVLFIDEAYSLMQGADQDFGREAVDTLVEEMTKHEDKLVIIFAGYEEPVERLLDSNPGLRSRVKQHLKFPDYSPSELIEILRLYVSNYGYELSGEAAQAITDYVREVPVNGNARAVKDMVEDAIQEQAHRLIESGDISDLLLPEDFGLKGVDDEN
ncbi:AAA family ATPase [Alkalicoccus chagannorensis]|uniref:AAA family ATPase n=1 Tax=Alkalicoccus chagannorensis TaxID=427072 RepID=UPI000423B7EA|nr:AAA family ATPase [Alkalicoccus chagannorensis]